MARAMTIGGLAAASATPISAIRYYERIGLLPAPARTAGGHRSYTPEHLRRLLFICRARELGFGVEQVRLLLTLSDPRRASCAEVRTLAARHLEDIRARMRQLRKAESILADMIAHCSGEAGLPCPVLSALEPSADVTA
jgi:MerR family transcriptional regulator, mercuric resistance operon regulatory protein